MLLQLLGNVLKIIFLLDLWLRPRKRYRIPAVSRAWLRARTEKSIPRIFWQTNGSADVTLSLYVNYLLNRLLTPTFEYRFFDDEACAQFIKHNCGREIHQCYSRLQIGAARADLWRVLVLLHEGGIYLDIDATFSWPPEWFLSADQDELFLRDPDRRLTNYCLAAAPGNGTIVAIRDRIAENITTNTLKSVFDMTGPTVVNIVAGAAPVTIETAKLVCRQGQLTQKRFQYPDRLKGYWAKEQVEGPIVK
ncbi:glycosyltransferase family 32 protein [Bradyrhizobium cytisi]|uniref:glycosyltransferase family 32 protein n=1 Tax=Bradyrhizobium cytisi TaxID=515489 RepID=UPI001652D2DB|nr:glycosyltransferase [Bradyrhizobium cytisi]